MMSAEPKVIVHMHGIVKRFPGVLANDQVEFSLHRVKSMHFWVKMEPGKVP